MKDLIEIYELLYKEVEHAHNYYKLKSDNSEFVDTVKRLKQQLGRMIDGKSVYAYLKDKAQKGVFDDALFNHVNANVLGIQERVQCERLSNRNKWSECAHVYPTANLKGQGPNSAQYIEQCEPGTGCEKTCCDVFYDTAVSEDAMNDARKSAPWTQGKNPVSRWHPTPTMQQQAPIAAQPVPDGTQSETAKINVRKAPTGLPVQCEEDKCMYDDKKKMCDGFMNPERQVYERGNKWKKVCRDAWDDKLEEQEYWHGVSVKNGDQDTKQAQWMYSDDCRGCKQAKSDRLTEGLKEHIRDQLDAKAKERYYTRVKDIENISDTRELEKTYEYQKELESALREDKWKNTPDWMLLHRLQVDSDLALYEVSVGSRSGYREKTLEDLKAQLTQNNQEITYEDRLKYDLQGMDGPTQQYWNQYTTTYLQRKRAITERQNALTEQKYKDARVLKALQEEAAKKEAEKHADEQKLAQQARTDLQCDPQKSFGSNASNPCILPDYVLDTTGGHRYTWLQSPKDATCNYPSTTNPQAYYRRGNVVSKEKLQSKLQQWYHEDKFVPGNQENPTRQF